MNRPTNSQTHVPKGQRFVIILIAVVVLVAGGAILLIGKGESSAGRGEKTEKAEAAKKPDEKKDSKGGDQDKIVLSEAQIKSAGIVLATVGPARLNLTVKFPGEIRFNEDRTAHVVPRITGVVESTSANLGQQVRKNQVLAVISSGNISDLRSEFLTAQKRQALAKSTYEREKKLWEEKISAQQDFLQATQAMQEADIALTNARQKLTTLGADAGTGSLSRYELRAPFDATVIAKHLALGEAVKEDAQVFTLSDLSQVWAEFSISPKDIPYVRVGAKAKVIASAFDASADGQVAYVGALLGEQTRTATARVVLPNPQGAWRPGLFSSVVITAEEVEVPLSVNTEAIQTFENAPVIFVRTADGFVTRKVRLGRSDGQRTEILSGLDSGAVYATGGNFVLKAELGKAGAHED